MTDELTDLKHRLDQIANTPRRRPQLAIPPLVARGRRTLRVRRAATVAGSAAGLGLVVTLTATGLPWHGAEDRPVSPPSVRIGPNPLVRRAVFGWLPKGYTPRTYIEDHQNGRHTYEVMAGLEGGMVDLTDFGTGPEPILGHLSGARPIRPLPAPPVNGKRAHWATKPGSGYGGRLRWQYAPHRWAEISVHGSADDAATIYRIARSVTFGVAKPTAFPFQVRGLPDDLAVCRSTAGPGLDGGTGDSADVAFAAGAFSPDNWLDISLTPTGRTTQRSLGDPGRKITIDGHRAVDHRFTSGGVARHSLDVLDVRGYDVRIQASGRTLRRLQSSGGVIGLYRRITVLGTVPSGWTTTPFR